MRFDCFHDLKKELFHFWNRFYIFDQLNIQQKYKIVLFLEETKTFISKQSKKNFILNNRTEIQILTNFKEKFVVLIIRLAQFNIFLEAEVLYFEFKNNWYKINKEINNFKFASEIDKSIEATIRFSDLIKNKIWRKSVKERELLRLLIDNLKEFIEPVVKNTRYDLAWIIALVNRECGWKVNQLLAKGQNIKDILTNMRGDYIQGKGYQGYSPFQIDIKSYPDFINSGEWKDLEKSAQKCIDVLEEKRKSLESYGWSEEKLGLTLFNRAITASYNCGQGNVNKALKNGKDVDAYTFNHDYSKDIFRAIVVVNELINLEKPTEEDITVTPPEQAQSIDGEDIVVNTRPEKANIIEE